MAGLRWRRAVSKGAIVAWIFGGFVVFLLALLLVSLVRHGAPVFARLTSLSHLERRSASVDREGAAVFSGRLEGPSWRTSPLGKPSVMWTSRVYQVSGSGRSRRSQVVCKASEISSVVLVAEGARVPIAWLDDLPMMAVVDMDSIDVREVDLTGQLDLGRFETSKVPSSMLARCKLNPLANLAYSEIHVSPDTSAEVTGCKRAGRIVACDEAPRVLSVNGVRSIAARWANRHDDVAVPAMLIGGFFLAMGIVAIVAQKRRHLRPFAEERAT